VLERAATRRRGGRGTVLFLDEIHRFNKAQQDALLPAVEDGTVTLVGATTENPYFEVNSALLSRCSVYELRALEPADVAELLRRGARELGAQVDDDALDFLARRSGGDARTALAALELAGDRVTLPVAEEALQQRAVRYDRAGDRHFDTISAWIKSTRASDVDASLYYLAVMLEGGEDPRFIARRMVVLASEDVGLADPHALPLALAAAQAVDRVGMPEAHYPLAHAATYLARAPKSAAAGRALHAARAFVRERGAQAPPGPLRSGPSAEPGYVSPHDDAAAAARVPLLPDDVRGRRFFTP
jgi:putative ATPase